MRREILSALNFERETRRAAIVMTDLESGEQEFIPAADAGKHRLAPHLLERLRLGKSGRVEIDGRDLFLLVQIPHRRLIVVGAVHISQALAPMAKLADIEMIIVDPRTAFATPDRFPDVDLIPEWPQDVLPRLRLDAFTGLAALTHDPKIDDPALMAALRSECFYIGALGSRKTHGKRLDRLRGEGFSEAQLSAIHAPIGLDIGAVHPAEIAVSILAEMIAVMGRKPLRSAKAA
ncbi:MAG: XdhC family protein [Methylovirgula sp.]|jgi:xanthine dehydrogenase accessory factor